MSACAQPLSESAIVEYLAGELAQQDEGAFEEHLFSCASCTRAVQRIGELTSAICEVIPPAVTGLHLERLRQRLRVRETHVEPGQHLDARFAPDVDLLVHTLHADLQGVPRVDLEVYDAQGQPFMSVEAVPFDAAEGLVHVACQRHFQGEAEVEDTRFRLLAVVGDERRVLGDFTLRHHWAVPV